MIKITLNNPICECGHCKKDHGSYGSCYRMVHRKERRRNEKGKYQVYQTHYECSCKEFKEIGETK
jgi:hypothetical protein